MAKRRDTPIATLQERYFYVVVALVVFDVHLLDLRFLTRILIVDVVVARRRRRRRRRRCRRRLVVVAFRRRRERSIALRFFRHTK